MKALAKFFTSIYLPDSIAQAAAQSHTHARNRTFNQSPSESHTPNLIKHHIAPKHTIPHKKDPKIPKTHAHSRLD
jgi:hypothetical protein